MKRALAIVPRGAEPSAPHPTAPPRITLTDYCGAAAITCLSVAQLRMMVHRKTIPHVRLAPRSVRFDVAELETWIAERRVLAKASGTWR